MNAIKFIAACAILAGAAASFGQNSERPVVDAQVRRIDLDTQKITLTHGEIPNIDMGAMTMVFRVQDPAVLKDVKAGDKVRFTADNVNGALTVMTLEVVRP